MSKPHYFEIVMNSYSDGVLNQEVVVREYANTGAELTAKQMAFAKVVMPSVLGAFDELSMPYQEQGLVEMADAFQGKSKGKAKGKPEVR
jgi:hypothetical protein